MKKVLVTGATGFTGGKVAERLVADGNRVVAFVRHTSDTRALEKLGIECRTVDLCDRDDVLANFEGIRKVFHIAAAYRSEHADQAEFHAVNVEATRHLLDAALEKGVERFVHCSTVGVQGEIDIPPADENYRLKPGDHYQQSKLDGELLALEYFRERGLPGAVVRPVGIYGPGDTRFLKLFKSINKNRFFMIGDGQVLYHMTYIDDLVQGFMLAGEKEAALGEVFTISGPDYTTINELVQEISRILGKTPSRLKIPFHLVYGASVVCDKLCKLMKISSPLYPRRVEFFHLDRAFTSEKARKLLDYNPENNLAQGLRKTAQWYKDNGLL